MANVYATIPVPSVTGSGAPVNVSAMGFDKLFSLSGTPNATINIEASNDGVNWVPVGSMTASNDLQRSFAAVFVRATVAGTASGVVLSVGSDDPGTDMTAITVPAGNGTGAAANVSAYGGKKTLIYNGGMDGCITIQASQDGGATFSDIVSFVGQSPASVNVYAAVGRLRAVVSGFASGVGVVSVCAAKDAAGGGAAADQTVMFWGNTQIGPLASTVFLTPGYSTAAAALADTKQIGPGGSKNAFSLEVAHNVPDSSPSTITYTLLVNGVASAIAVTLGANTAGGESANVAVPLVATDRISLQAELNSALADGGNMNITVALRGV